MINSNEESVGKCCYCKSVCNWHSQSCGRCARSLTGWSLGNICLPNHLSQLMGSGLKPSDVVAKSRKRPRDALDDLDKADDVDNEKMSQESKDIMKAKISEYVSSCFGSQLFMATGCKESLIDLGWKYTKGGYATKKEFSDKVKDSDITVWENEDNLFAWIHNSLNYELVTVTLPDESRLHYIKENGNF